MALERRGSGVYYYTSRRIGRRVVKQYDSSGEVAVLSAQLDTANRQLRKFSAQEQQLETDFLRAETDAFREWFKAADAVVAEGLLRCGWHRARRQWRRQRGTSVSTLATIEQLTWVPAELAAAAGGVDTATVANAKKGDKAALKVVDTFFEKPAAKALWGDLGRHVLAKWVQIYAAENELLKRGLLRFASDLRTNLAGPNPSALDLLLAERVVLGWLVLNWCEFQYAHTLAKMSWKDSECHTRRIDAAHRRLMSACRTLAKVRRMNVADVVAFVSVKASDAGVLADGQLVG